MMRLQKFMAYCGVGSRRKCEEIIREGRVYLNGKKVNKMGVLVDPEKDKVTIEGVNIKPNSQLILQTEKIYILLNKPAGVITSVRDQFSRPTVLDIMNWKGSRIYPVGRLDYDTEGLLILTNDGQFAYEMTHPKYQIEKEYFCIVKGNPNPEQLGQLRKGIDIGGFVTSPAEVNYLGNQNGDAKVRIIIIEGKNRQVRRMFDAIGHPVIFLRRERLGNIQLGNLETGKWRKLTASEIKKLKTLARGK
jgi:23S rRNA pseudouridine2605 synthase